MIRRLSAALLLLALPAGAEVPEVAADIPPVHALVATVMGELGAPELVVPAGASPHDFALRPSQAAALEQAEIVFRTGTRLSPALDRAVEQLAGDAQVVSLIDAPGTTLLPVREDAAFEAHDHAEDAHGHDDDGHAEHGDAADPHAWLDPDNGKAWLSAIAAELARLDPENAATYAANAAAGQAAIDATAARIAATLAPHAEARFIVFHDAFQYFENRFGLPAAGAIALSDAADPSPARIDEIRRLADDLDVSCVFAEPQFDDGIVRAVSDDADVGAAVLDPLGTALEPGPDLYHRLLTGIADAMADCL